MSEQIKVTDSYFRRLTAEYVRNGNLFPLQRKTILATLKGSSALNGSPERRNPAYEVMKTFLETNPKQCKKTGRNILKKTNDKN